MGDTSPNAYSVEKLPNGGYLIRDAWMQPGYASSSLFAASNIDDALDFIRQKLR